MAIRPDSREGVNPLTDQSPHSKRFKELARELEADEDEARWDERLKKVVAQKPEPEKPDAVR